MGDGSIGSLGTGGICHQESLSLLSRLSKSILGDVHLAVGVTVQAVFFPPSLKVRHGHLTRMSHHPVPQSDSRENQLDLRRTHQYEHVEFADLKFVIMWIFS